MKKRTKLNWQKQMIFAAIATIVFIFAANSLVFAQANYKVGDKIEVVYGSSTWYKAEVLEAKDGSYKIRYDGYGSSWDEWVKTDRMRPLKDEAAKPPKKQNEANEENKKQPGENQTTENEPGAKYKPGDRVECDTMGIGTWFKGTVLPYLEKDEPHLSKDKTGKYFYIHRVRLDNDMQRPEGGMCFTDRTRLLTGAAAQPPPVDTSVGRATVDENNTLSADRPILDCPVQQTTVRNGARPNAELLKKITRCDKGEKPASKGYDGAVTVDVTALQIAASRPWIYSRDIGGKPGTTIYPVKVTYTVKTFYRNRTVVDENWIRIINFYVNEFGEWQSGSEEHVKSPDSKDVPRIP